MSAAASRLGCLDRVVSRADRLSHGLIVCELEHRRCVAALCMFNKIYCNPNHILEVALPRVPVLAKLTRLAVSVHSRYLDVPNCCTVHLEGCLFLHLCN